MTNEHPITPPPDLTARWLCSEDYLSDVPTNSTMTITSSRLQNVATQAARWGADQKLEACIERLDINGCPDKWIDLLRDLRLKPPSLKEQALADLDSMSIEPCLINGIDVNAAVRAKHDNIRRALKALPDNS